MSNPLEKAAQNYDPNMYKPSHEREDETTTLGALSASKQVDLTKEFLKKVDHNVYRNNKINYQQYPIFSPLDPEEPLSGPEDAKGDKAFLIVIAFVGIWIFVMLAATEWLEQITTFPTWVVIICEILVGIVLMMLVITKFVYKVDSKVTEASKIHGNKSIAVSSVWNINAGGIVEDRIMSQPSTTVYYRGKESLILKVLKKSTLVSGSLADWSNYESLRIMEDYLLKNEFNFSKLIMDYNTDNDPIWTTLDNNLVESTTVFGSEYSKIMVDFTTFLHNQTRTISTVSVIYYIIKPNFIRPNVQYKVLAEQCKTMLQSARCSISPISTKEFLRLIRDYYGLSYLDINKIVEGISALQETEIEVSLLNYVNEKGELVNLNKIPTAEIQNFYHQKAKPIKVKDIPKKRDINIIEAYSLFGDKVVKQVK